MAWSAPYNRAEYMEYLEAPKSPDWVKVAALNTNDTAYVVYDRANGVYALQSYSTICSIQVGDSDVRLGRWSVTTSKHQCHFSRWCASHPH